MEELEMILSKDGEGRSYDDILCIRNVILKISYFVNCFADIIFLQSINNFCKNLTLDIKGKGDVIYSEGSSNGRFFHLLIKGCVEMKKNGAHIPEHKFESGMIFGEDYFQHDQPRLYTATCTTETSLIVISYDNVEKMKEFDIKMAQQEDNTWNKEAKIFQILSKCRDKRTEQEVRDLSDTLKSKMSFFSKFSIDQQNELCRVTESVSVSAQNIVFREGQYGQAYYIVLRGVLELYVKGDSTMNRHKPDHYDHGDRVSVLKVWDTFGERALESLQSKRKGTVIASEYAELLVIFREDYYNTISVLMQKKTKEKLLLLRKSTIFQNIDMRHLNALAKVMEPRIFRFDEVLFQSGSKVTGMLIIASGEARVEVRVEAVCSDNNKNKNKISDSIISGTPNASKSKAVGSDDQSQISALSMASFPSTINSSIISKSASFNSSLKCTHRPISPIVGPHVVCGGRIGPCSILAPEMMLCENGLEDVYHVETVVASCIVQAYVVCKHDFITNVPEYNRKALQKCVIKMQNSCVPNLWDRAPKRLGEKEWKAGQIWAQFRTDLANCNIKNPDIITNMRAFSNIHLTSESGNASGILPPKFGGTNESCKGPSTSTSSIGRKEMVQNTKLLTSINSTELMNKSNSNIIQLEHLNHKNEIVLHAVERSKARDEQILLKKQIKSKEGTTLTSITSNESAQNNVYTTIERASNSKKNDVTALSTGVNASTRPFVLVHFSVERCNRKLGNSSGRGVTTFVRFCGNMTSFGEAKDVADVILGSVYITLLGRDPKSFSQTSKANWNLFTSFENIPLHHSDFFIVYCQSIPLEYAQFTSKVPMTQYSFPFEEVVSDQQFACVRFNKIVISPYLHFNSKIANALLLQELSVMQSFLATSTTSSQSLRYALLETMEGRDIWYRMKKVCGWDQSATMLERSGNFEETHQTTRLCVVPMFQWIPLRDNILCNYEIGQMVFHSLHYDSMLEIATAGTPTDDMVFHNSASDKRNSGIPDNDNYNNEIFKVQPMDFTNRNTSDEFYVAFNNNNSNNILNTTTNKSGNRIINKKFMSFIKSEPLLQPTLNTSKDDSKTDFTIQSADDSMESNQSNFSQIQRSLTEVGLSNIFNGTAEMESRQVIASSNGISRNTAAIQYLEHGVMQKMLFNEIQDRFQNSSELMDSPSKRTSASNADGHIKSRNIKIDKRITNFKKQSVIQDLDSVAAAASPCDRLLKEQKVAALQKLRLTRQALIDMNDAVCNAEMESATKRRHQELLHEIENDCKENDLRASSSVNSYSYDFQHIKKDKKKETKLNIIQERIQRHEALLKNYEILPTKNDLIANNLNTVGSIEQIMNGCDRIKGYKEKRNKLIDSSPVINVKNKNENENEKKKNIINNHNNNEPIITYYQNKHNKENNLKEKLELMQNSMLQYS